MTHLIQVVCFVQLASIALSVLPDPVNVIIDSNNFDHILRWDPGAGTPMGMNYSVEWCCRYENKWSKVRCLNEKDGRECNLTKTFQDIHGDYKARVKAITETQQSGWTESKWFQPVSQTILGPPEASVSGCGDCLLLQFRPLESLLDIYYGFDYSIVMKRAGEKKNSSKMITTLNEYKINNLERATNYCVSVAMSANTNGNSKVSQWHCAFTSPEGKSKVPFLLVAVCVPLVLSAAVMAALVYSGYLCKPRTQLPKVLASFTLHHSSCSLQQCLVAERCPVVPVFIYKQDRKLKSRSQTLLDSSESEDTDSGGEDGYEAQTMLPAVCLCSSSLLGEPKQAYDPDDPAQKQRLLVCDELLVELPQDQPDLEEKEPLIEGRDSEQEESHQDIPLFSVLLERHDDDDDDDDEILESPPVEVAVDQEDSKLLQEQQESPLMGSIESVNCVTDHLNIELKDNEEQRYYSDSEEEEDDCELSGYMRLCDLLGEIWSEDSFYEMIQFIKLMCFLHLVPIASCEFPAPVNVTLRSHNFQHILRWEPGPGTPERVQYRVRYNSITWFLMKSCLNVTNTRECDLTVVFDDVNEHYAAQVQAFNETQHSDWTSMSSTFKPFSDTILGPPEVSVSGCGNCLSLQIKPPTGKGKMTLLQLYYQFDYRIEMQNMKDGYKISEKLEKCKGTVNHNKELEPGTEYCVTVWMYRIGMNMNSKPSEPQCAFTSPQPVSKVPGVLVSLFIFFLLMALVVSSLIYSGYLCSVKANLPQVLASCTVHSANLKRVFVPESCTVVEHVSLSHKHCSIKKRSGRKLLDSSESEHSDSGEIDGYENCAFWVPDKESSNNEPVDTEETVTPVELGQALVPGDPAQALCLVVCGKTAGPPVEQPDPEQLEPLLERADSVKEEICQDVNLFSVILGATDEDIFESPSVEVVLVVEDQPQGCCNMQEDPQEDLQESPLMVALESVEIEDKEQLSCCSESESEESDCEPSGYMRRSVQ
ncbi:hypothetical protein HHUSO_G10760 [Huso huso]|uniref:Fibronectin type-III domain-containing protein n=1 Tax=Huso huso TaxID=61971 RepID=A0ABR0ZQS6_HUSHU